MPSRSFGSKPVYSTVKGDLREFHLNKLQEYAEIKALIKVLEAAANEIETDLKETGFQTIVQMITPTRIESFRAIDGSASASVEMRKRSSNSALSEAECNLLILHGITPEKKQITPSFLAVNSSYVNDRRLMTSVQTALAQIAPKDFLMNIDGTHRFVVSEQMVDFAFKVKDVESLRVMTTMAIKPSLENSYSISKLFTSVKKQLLSQ